MRLQHAFRALTVLFSIFCGRLASAEEEALCFDFRTKITEPLKEFPRGDGDMVHGGMTADRIAWSFVRGDVQKPLEKMLELIVDHHAIKNPLLTEVIVEPLDKGPYLAHQRVSKTAKALFVSVQWKEEWVFALAEGTPESPQKIVISYQKTEGSKHITNFCHNIVLRRTATGTDFSHYSQGRVTGRSFQQMQDSSLKLLQRIRDR